MRGSSWVLLFCLVSAAYAQRNHSAITPDLLVKIGQKFNRPLIQLLGEAFKNTEEKLFKEIRSREEDIFDAPAVMNETFMDHVCELMRCEAWSNWTECRLDEYQFNMKTRSRRCGVSNALCTYRADQADTETQSKVCTDDDLTPIAPPKAQCPSNYEVINGQFCLRYSSRQDSKEAAEEECLDEGGFLIHVDSQAKQVALHKLLADHSVGSTCIWLNGQRTTARGSWNYQYGDKNPSWDNWSSGEPSNGSSELCKVSESSPRVWWDRECNNNYYFVCEIEI